MFIRMIIAEVVSEEQIEEFLRLTKETMEESTRYKTLVSTYDLMKEAGGNMVILITKHHNRDAAIEFHSSREARQLVAKTQHLLLGSFVVKMFDNI